MLSDNLVADKGLNAVALVKELAKEIKGGGGGQPFYATAGGKELSGLEAIPAKAQTLVTQVVGV
jgi:alanyl-tRNA synthetase